VEDFSTGALTQNAAGARSAKVAIARKMLTLCYYGLRDGEIRCLNVPDRRSR
jgi:hypothetical protein